MEKHWLKAALWVMIAVGMAFFILPIPVRATVLAQQPTGSIPTVTGTPSGPIVKVYLDLDQITVYAGPSSYIYPAVGVLLAGQEAPALARGEEKDWIQIYYPGIPGSVAWVYAPYVSISPGADLPILAPPPTPTMRATPTINPTLVAVYIPVQGPTRLPTFTPPPPLVIPTFTETAASRVGGRLPMGLVILGVVFFGLFGALISFLRGR